MNMPGSDLELLEAVRDSRLGGSDALLTKGLARFEEEARRPGLPLFEWVGNNCLVFFTNDRAKQICEDNPDTMKGIVVGNYDCIIHPESVIVGSYLSGSVGSPAHVDFGSEVYYSNLIMAHVRRSHVARSRVSLGLVDDSTINDSCTSGNLRNMNLDRSYVNVGAINDMEASGQVLAYAIADDRPDTDGLTMHMLAQNGIRSVRTA